MVWAGGQVQMKGGRRVIRWYGSGLFWAGSCGVLKRSTVHRKGQGVQDGGVEVAMGFAGQVRVGEGEGGV